MKNFISWQYILTPRRRGQPLYKWQDAWSQVVLYISGSFAVHVQLCLFVPDAEYTSKKSPAAIENKPSTGRSDGLVSGISTDDNWSSLE